MDIRQYYRELLDKQIECKESSCRNHAVLIAATHQKISDVEAIFSNASSNPEGFVYKSIVYDLGLSLFFVISGQYRQSYIAQRAVLENTIGALFYSAHLLDFRGWSVGDIDISWSKVSASESGVFSRKYFEAFCPSAIGDSAGFQERARDLYSQLSNFVHKHVSVHEYDGANFLYDEKFFKETVESIGALSEIVTFYFCVRYFEEWSSAIGEQIDQPLESLIGDVSAFHGSKGEVKA